MTALLHFKSPLLKTPFHPRTEAANKLWSWGNWGGYTTARPFADLAMERSASRTRARRRCILCFPGSLARCCCGCFCVFVVVVFIDVVVYLTLLLL